MVIRVNTTGGVFVLRICGIYAIKNLITRKIYIGQSNNITRRINDHKKELKNGIHNNTHIQRSWNKYGCDNFTFNIIEECLENELNEKEIYYIKEYRLMYELYNQTEGGKYGLRGYTHSEKTKEKLRQKRKNQIFSEETRQKLIKAHIGRKSKPMSEEQKEKLRQANLGKEVSEETKIKISESLKGRTGPNKDKRFTEDHKRKISESGKGRIFSEEHRRRIGEANKRRITTNETKEKRRINATGHIHTEEHKNKISEGLKGRIVSPESREKSRKTMLARLKKQ
jgi:group I intron endonuclease